MLSASTRRTLAACIASASTSGARSPTSPCTTPPTGRCSTSKCPPRRPILRGDRSRPAHAAGHAAHRAAATIGFIGHGTTVATNMVIERRGVRYRPDHHARLPRRVGDRPPGTAASYDYTVRTPRAAGAARASAGGARADRCRRCGVACRSTRRRWPRRPTCWPRRACRRSPLLPAQLPERRARARAARIVRARLPGVYRRTSSDVLPEFREFERFSTTAINAYIGPRMERYLDRSSAGCRGAWADRAALHHPFQRRADVGGNRPRLPGALLPVGSGRRRGRRGRGGARGRLRQSHHLRCRRHLHRRVADRARRAGVRFQPARSPTIRCGRRWWTCT